MFSGDADEPGRRAAVLCGPMVDRGDSDAVEYRRIVGEACAVEVREQCRFPEEHLHVTLAEGRCTGKEAAQIKLRSAVPACLASSTARRSPGHRCLALGLDEATPLYDLACDLEMPSTVKNSRTASSTTCLYIAANGRGDDLAQETGKMKVGREFRGHGSVELAVSSSRSSPRPTSPRASSPTYHHESPCATCASPLLETCPIPYETRSPTPARRSSPPSTTARSLLCVAI